jgi:hypothetical protein
MFHIGIGDNENPFINRLKRSVLQSVTVGYSPNGWAAHSDGYLYKLHLIYSFKELELVDKIDIQNGY